MGSFRPDKFYVVFSNLSNMPHFIEYIADDSLLSETVFETVSTQIRLNEVERKPDGGFSGWNQLFNVHTHEHENTDRPNLNTVVSLRIRDRSLWDQCKTQSVALLVLLLEATESDLEFYSFWHLECYRRNGGINICTMPNVKNHQQFWNETIRRQLKQPYSVVARDYSRF